MARMTHQVAVAKLETVYATDSAPAAATAADVILFRNCTITGLQADQAERPRVQPWHGARGRPGLSNRTVALQGDVPLCGSGTAGTVPAWGKLMRACGMAEVITAATRVDYTPVSAGQESTSLHWFMDGSRHRTRGARGTFTLNLAAGQEASVEFAFTGLYVDPDAQALPNAAFTAWRDALVPRNGISTFTAAGSTLPMRSLRYTHGNAILARDIPSRAEVRITDRTPALEVTLEAPDGFSPANFFALAAAETEHALSATHGVTAGDTIGLSWGQARLLPGIRYDRDGDVALLTLSYLPRPSVGNDEFTLTAR